MILDKDFSIRLDFFKSKESISRFPTDDEGKRLGKRIKPVFPFSRLIHSQNIWLFLKQTHLIEWTDVTWMMLENNLFLIFLARIVIEGGSG